MANQMSNQFGITCDAPGLCALCHTEVAEFEGSIKGNPKVKRFKGNAIQMPVMLDDGSRMLVILCTFCFHGFKPEHMKPLMESVIQGWDREVGMLPWTEEKRIAHMAKYAKRYVTDRADFPLADDDRKKIQKPELEKLDLRKGVIRGTDK